MRVIAGRWRGRRLAPAPPGVRPSSDRVRERLFAVIEAHLDGARVLDLCCGTGSLGIEALSRGAAAALFVDRASGSLAVLERNLAPLRAAAPELEIVLRRAEALLFVRKHWPAPPPEVVFLDPPYGEALGPALVEALASRRPALVVYESEDRDCPQFPGLTIERVLRFGDTRVTLLRGGEAP